MQPDEIRVGCFFHPRSAFQYSHYGDEWSERNLFPFPKSSDVTFVCFWKFHLGRWFLGSKYEKKNRGVYTIHMSNDQNPPVTWTMKCWLVNYWIFIMAIFWIPTFFGCSHFPNPPGWLACFRDFWGASCQSHIFALRIQVCPKKGINPTILGLQVFHTFFAMSWPSTLKPYRTWLFLGGNKKSASWIKSEKFCGESTPQTKTKSSPPET